MTEKRIEREQPIVLRNAAAGVTVNLDDGRVSRGGKLDGSLVTEPWWNWERVEIRPSKGGKGESVMILRDAAGRQHGPETLLPARGITYELAEWRELATVEFRGAATLHIFLRSGPLPKAYRPHGV